MVKLGVDISNHNGNIDMSKAAHTIDFAIIRAGYGNTYDARVNRNIDECEKNNVPFGLYWFSYALSVENCKKEADLICDLADKHLPLYPICFDWEYDSDKYAAKCGVNITNEKRKQFAEAFLRRVEERGYYTMLYTNIDYLNKGFEPLTDRYDVWLAQWYAKSPSKNCGIWQKCDNGVIAGIGTCDLNISYKDYPTILSSLYQNKNKNTSTSEIEKIKEKLWNKYLQAAKDTIEGKYNNGEERKKILASLGYDASIVQEIVNELIK